jgi:hypothetical protein
MGLAKSMKAVARPLVAPVNRKLEDLFRHVSNEAWETRQVIARLTEELNPALQGATEVAAYVEFLIDRIEGRLGAAGFPTDGEDVGDAWVLAGLGALPVGARVLLVSSRPSWLARTLADLGLDVTVESGGLGAGAADAEAVSVGGVAWVDRPEALTRARAGQLRDALDGGGVLVLAAPVEPAGVEGAEETLAEVLAGWSVDDRRVAVTSGSGWRTSRSPGTDRAASADAGDGASPGAGRAVLLWRARPG